MHRPPFADLAGHFLADTAYFRYFTVPHKVTYTKAVISGKSPLCTLVSFLIMENISTCLPALLNNYTRQCTETAPKPRPAQLSTLCALYLCLGGGVKGQRALVPVTNSVWDEDTQRKPGAVGETGNCLLSVVAPGFGSG